MRIVTTAYDGEKAAVTEAAAVFCPDSGNRETEILNIYPRETFQRVLGFGGAFTEAAGAVYSRLTPEKQREFMDACFGPGGLGYTLGRCHLDSCDFCLDNFSADPYQDDEELARFSLERDARYVFPLLDAALERQSGLRLMLSPWSPPAYMKSNGGKNGGGRLLPQYRERWAEYMCRYVSEYRRAGYPVCALSVQNEPNAVQPWDSCVYTAGEERDFLRDFLTPALCRHGLSDVTLTVWDHNKERLFDRVDAIWARRSSRRGKMPKISFMRAAWSRWPRRHRAKPPSSRLSSTDISPNSSRFSGTRPTPASTMASTLGRAIGCPPSLSVPVEPSRPMMAFSSVDLPAPLGPMTVTISPSPTVSATWCTASTGP